MELCEFTPIAVACPSPQIAQVVVASVGADVTFALDYGPDCERIVAYEKAMGDVKGTTLKAEAKGACCSTCVEVTLSSGDIIIFDGHPGSGVAHGVLDTHRGTEPEDLPTWARDCRVSMQFRVSR